MQNYSLQRVHCVGIGGIGVSAVARILHQLGSAVFGTDVFDSLLVKQLKKEGITIVIGVHRAESLKAGTTLVVYSNAVQEKNPELVRAKKLKIPCLSYPEFLGWFMNKHIPIVVSGTHGKSTTTAMLATIFLEAGLDPMVVVGTQVPAFGNSHVGLGKHFIVEGDEYRAAFHHYTPDGLIINNIESDHLDFYRTEKNVVTAFDKLARSVPKGGTVVANAEDSNVQKVLKRLRANVTTFGLAYGDYYVGQIERHGEITRFSVRGIERFDLAIRVPGDHNIRNALGAALMARSFGISIDQIQRGLLVYRGCWRRFEITGEPGGVVVVDDYAHHPTEIRATLQTAKQYFPKRRIWCIFQPHSTHRTKSLFKDFVTAFGDADTLVLSDIYLVSGRETAERLATPSLVKEISKIHPDVQYYKSFSAIVSAVTRQIRTGDIIITMGAGTITEINERLISAINRKMRGKK
ncbi:MAG: UDP-N-acetylmuramate--L-alanine ligase [Candidatus Kerfeldbacteria bacterium]|nr:UDP-N-acetylmuramate--L-alanine ligase [Candidatus Kerfeldbacteria bacterium]